MNAGRCTVTISQRHKWIGHGLWLDDNDNLAIRYSCVHCGVDRLMTSIRELTNRGYLQIGR